MRKAVLLAAVFSGALTQAGATTVPKLSGAYAVSYNEICQAGNPSNPTPGIGETYTEILVIAFNATTKKATLTGTKIYGPLTGPYVPLKSSSFATSPSAYSNTATTITVNGTTFDAVYGPSNSSGVAESLVFGGAASGGCAASATAILQ